MPSLYCSFIFLIALLILVAVVSTVCTPLGVLNAVVGSRRYRVVANQAYGPDPRQQLDVYVPKHMKVPADVIIFFYGGRWRSGTRRDYRFVAEALGSRGFMTVIPNYRLYPCVDWRGLVDDGASIYHWVETHIGTYHGNPRRIFLMGHSAGAHIAAMVALNRSLRAQTGSRIPPCGMIGLAGPYDFLPIRDPDVQEVFGTARNPQETQPIHYVEPDSPDLLLLAGAADTTVDPRNSDRLAAAMRRVGGKVDVAHYPGIGHIGILLSLATPFRFRASTLADTTDFIHRTV